ncbi:MAG TPA: DNA primase, partial [Chitinophagales bacterium]
MLLFFLLSRPVISKFTIARIKDEARIDEVVGEFVTLKKRGSSMIGNCPFHNEKTPSFNVSVSKNIFKCFGCGKAGDSITFLMEHLQLNYSEALRYIAKKYNIAVEEEYVSEEQKKEEEIQHSLQESITIANQFAQRFFTDYMLQNENGKIGLAYFKERGFSTQTIEKFQLGFSPEGGSELTEAALKQGFQLDILKKAGLTSPKEDSRYDFFRNRAMFPIHNLMGKVIAFGGRILKKDERAPKYVNTPESEVYIKSKILYGIFQAKNAIRKQDECLLCEGYTDVISLVQNGIENVVASSGTALTVEQIKLVKRFTPNITLLYDGDSAGIKAALRGTDLILEEGMNVRVVILPEPEDPDSYIKAVGTTAFEDYIRKNKKDLILFKSSLFASEAKNDPIKKAELVKDIVHSIAKIPDPIQRSIYVRSCAEQFAMPEQLLIIEVNKARRKIVADKNKASTGSATDTSIPEITLDEQRAAGEVHHEQMQQGIASLDYYEKDIVRLLMECGAWKITSTALSNQSSAINTEISVAQFVFDELEGVEFSTRYKYAYDFIQAQTQPLESNQFLQNEDPKIAAIAMELLTSPYELSEGWWRKYQVLVPDQRQVLTKDIYSATMRLKQFHNIEEIKKLERMLQREQEKPTEEQNFDEVIRLMQFLKILNEQRQKFSKETGTVIFRP